MAARFVACACGSGPRRGIVLAALVGLTGPWRLSPPRQSCASLRTRYDAPWPAWKVARLRERAARRRVWVPGAHTDTSGINPSAKIRPISKAWASTMAMGNIRSSGQHPKQTQFSEWMFRRRAFASPRGKLEMALRLTATARSWPVAPLCLPRTHTRRRADRSLTLATFHAGQGASYRVRRDARD